MLRATGRKTTVLAVSVPKPVDEALRLFAESCQVTLSSAATDAICAFLASHGVDVPEPGATVPAPAPARRPRLAPGKPLQEAVRQ
jgi:hypothetical protein